MNERDAITRLRVGDIGGLEALVREHQVRAVRAAFAITQDRSLAEDVVATAFLKAYESIDQFDTRRPFGPWFLRIVVNDATKAAVAKSRHVSLDRREEGGGSLADLLVDSGPGPEELAERAEARTQFRAALAKLPPRQRESIVMRYYLGLRETEVAARQGTNVGTVKQHLFRARRRLSSLLAGLVRSDSRDAGAIDLKSPAPRSDHEKGDME